MKERPPARDRPQVPQQHFGFRHPVFLVVLVATVASGGLPASIPSTFSGPDPILHVVFALMLAVLLLLYALAHNGGHMMWRSVLLATWLVAVGAMCLLSIEAMIVPGSVGLPGAEGVEATWGERAIRWAAVGLQGLGAAVLGLHWTMTRTRRARRGPPSSESSPPPSREPQAAEREKSAT